MFLPASLSSFLITSEGFASKFLSADNDSKFYPSFSKHVFTLYLSVLFFMSTNRDKSLIIILSFRRFLGLHSFSVNDKDDDDEMSRCVLRLLSLACELF